MPVPEGCKFAKMCKHFNSSSYTCRFEEEASVYCGTYDLFAYYKSPAMAEAEKELYTS